MTALDLVGRDGELRRLRRALRQHQAGVLITGPAGVGKTRLVEEVARARRHVVWARGARHRRPVPLAALAEAVPAEVQPAVAVGEVSEMADALRRLLDADDGGAAPGLLIADDVHAFDEPSAEVLAHLIADPGVAVIATARSEEELPSLVALAVTHLEELELGPLDDVAVEALAEAVAGAPLAPVAAARLQRLAAGNPLYVAELTRDALARGTLRQDRDGRLRLAEALEPPTELVDLLQTRIDGLADDERDALEVVAVAQPLSLTDAARLASMPLFERLARAQLLTVDRSVAPAVVSTAHPLLGEVVLSSLPPARHREHCRRLVAALRDRDGRDPVALARWHLDAGEPHDPELLLAGARDAAARFDAEQAARLARAAGAAGAGPEADLVLGEALAARPATAGDAEEVLAGLESGVVADEALLVRATTARARNLLFGLGRADLAAEVAADVSGTVADPSWRAELRAVQGLAAMLLGDVGTAARVGEGVEVGAGVDARSVVTVRTVATLGQVMLGRLTGVEALLDEARELLADLPLRDHLALADLQLEFTRSYLDVYGGRLARAHERASRAVERATAHGEDARLALWLGMLGHVELIHGDLAGAMRHGAEADALLVSHDLLRVRAQSICQRGVAAAGLGLREEAVRALGQVREVEPDPPPRVAVHVGRLEAWVDLLDERLDEGAARLRTAARVGSQGQHPVWAALALYDAVTVGRAAAVLGDLEAIAAEVDAELVLAMTEHARAAAAGDLDALRRVADRLWACGAALHAAQALLDAADLAGAAGDERGATGLRLAAWARVPASDAWTVQGRLEVPELTEREQEIAELAASGLSSREVAERLVVSQRTVDNHLSAVYRKLGLRGRSELRELLGIRTV